MTYIFPKRKLNIPTIRYYPYKLTYVPIKGDKCTHTERQSNQSTDEMIAIKILLLGRDFILVIESNKDKQSC